MHSCKIVSCNFVRVPQEHMHPQVLLAIVVLSQSLPRGTSSQDWPSPGSPMSGRSNVILYTISSSLASTTASWCTSAGALLTASWAARSHSSVSIPALWSTAAASSLKSASGSSDTEVNSLSSALSSTPGSLALTSNTLLLLPTPHHCR